MSTSLTETAKPSIADLACCINCKTPLLGRNLCPACNRAHETRDGVTQAIGPLRGATASWRPSTMARDGSVFASGNSCS